ncbi:MAG: sugar ABC transporter permease [Coriobacteriales bacterium]|jgi:multiple sugar transport system permease protein|nr:sugar ABC transporter permease [Coriobacteriales bacterium]
MVIAKAEKNTLRNETVAKSATDVIATASTETAADALATASTETATVAAATDTARPAASATVAAEAKTAASAIATASTRPFARPFARFFTRSGIKGLVWLLPSLVGVSVLFAIPFIDVIRRSFLQSIGGRWVGLANYNTVIQNEAFHLAVSNTALFTAICIPLLLVVSFVIAVLIHRQKYLSSLFKMGFLLPMALPVVAVAVLWQILFDYNGILNNLFTNLGLQSQHWLDGPMAFWVLVGGYIWRNLGFSIILWLAALEAIPEKIYEAARLDGAGYWALLRHITLPAVLPAGFTIAVLALINSFKVFREAYLVAGSYPHESMYTIQHLFNNWFTSLSFDKISAAAVLVSIVMFAFVLLLYRAWGNKDEVS